MERGRRQKAAGLEIGRRQKAQGKRAYPAWLSKNKRSKEGKEEGPARMLILHIGAPS